MSYLANIMRLGQTPETSFNQWAWDLALRLKLHTSEKSPQGAWCPLPSSEVPNVLEVTDLPTMHPVLKGVKSGIPIGCFLALDMSTVGHRFRNQSQYDFANCFLLEFCLYMLIT